MYIIITRKKKCVKRKLQGTWNCNCSYFSANVLLSGWSWVCKADQPDGKPETSQSSRRGSNPRPRRSAASPRVPEWGGVGRGDTPLPGYEPRGWWSVWLRPPQGLASEPGEYLPARSKLRLSIAIPSSGSRGERWTWRSKCTVGLQLEGWTTLSAGETNWGPSVSRGWRWRMLGQSGNAEAVVRRGSSRALAAATGPCEQSRGMGSSFVES